MSSEDHLLAIDLGTSGPKVALFRVSGPRVDAEFEPVQLLLSAGGGAEQSPHAWWDAIVAATRRLGARQPDAMRRVVGVGCTAQWSGTVPVDANGQPLGNAVLWMDSRGARHVRDAVSSFPRVLGYGVGKLVRWIRLTGGAPGLSGKDSLAHILFLKQEQAERYAQARWLLEPKDYLNLRLTGVAAASYDSIALHWVTDNRRADAVAYHPGLLRMAGIDGAKLPPLKRAIDVLGPLLPEAASALGVPAQARVVAGAPDVHSAAVGSGAVRDFEPHLYLGTSSWLTCHVPFKKTDVLHNMATIVSPVPGRYLIGNEQETAGACLTWLRDQVFGLPESGGYAEIDRLAAEAPAGSGKVIFTPWLYGERTPIEDPHIRGGFHNVSLRTRRSELARAVLEGVAYNARWLLQAVEGFIRRRVESIRVIGGGARSDLWCQIQADVLDRPIRKVADPVQANARGAALITAVGLGMASFNEVHTRVPIERTFTPDADRAVHDELFDAFVRLYKANRAIHSRLNAPR